ncbi:MAG: hypothetical protein RIC18_09160 [Hoeflea sp.]|uniref:hypothetical protein n=1 Tax=Hoeflea sp. TaxID=1940281 RepID=UPI0032EEF633
MRKILAVFAGLGLIVAAFTGLMLALALTVTAAGAMAIARLTGRFKPAVAGNGASRKNRASDRTREYRVWNDGRGTIIDM